MLDPLNAKYEIFWNCNSWKILAGSDRHKKMLLGRSDLFCPIFLVGAIQISDIPNDQLLFFWLASNADFYQRAIQ
jgi:hypothetical protein